MLAINSTTRSPPKKQFRDVHNAVQVQKEMFITMLFVVIKCRGKLKNTSPSNFKNMCMCINMCIYYLCEDIYTYIFKSWIIIQSAKLYFKDI